MITYWINKMLPPKKKVNVFSQILSTLLLQISSRKKLKILIKKKKNFYIRTQKTKKTHFLQKRKKSATQKKTPFFVAIGITP